MNEWQRSICYIHLYLLHSSIALHLFSKNYYYFSSFRFYFQLKILHLVVFSAFSPLSFNNTIFAPVFSIYLVFFVVVHWNAFIEDEWVDSSMSYKDCCLRLFIKVHLLCRDNRILIRNFYLIKIMSLFWMSDERVDFWHKIHLILIPYIF